MNRIIRSPFQFSGNKKKAIQNGLIELLEQSGKDKLADMMCGSGVVGLNWNRGNVILNDSNWHIWNMHHFLKHHPQLIEAYLSDWELFDLSNEEEYYSLRESYNTFQDASLLLVLIQISFNSLLRFNQKGQFNAPFGHNKKQYDSSRILEAMEHYRKVSAVWNKSLFELAYDSLLDHVLYFDPPYYMSKYSYSGWSKQTEEDFWNLVVNLSKTHKVAVSNVLKYRGKLNNILMDKCVEHGLLVNIIGNVTYNNWQKAVSTVDHDTRTTEVLITNFTGEKLAPF